MYRPGLSGLPASESKRRMMFQPVILSAFFAGSKVTPLMRNSSAIEPAAWPPLAKIASSATPIGRTSHCLHHFTISSARMGTVQFRPMFGLSRLAVISSSTSTRLLRG
ncbi:hypothetical protein D3C84_1112490 [compost metagenome]